MAGHWKEGIREVPGRHTRHKEMAADAKDEGQHTWSSTTSTPTQPAKQKQKWGKASLCHCRQWGKGEVGEGDSHMHVQCNVLKYAKVCSVFMKDERPPNTGTGSAIEEDRLSERRDARSESQAHHQ